MSVVDNIKELALASGISQEIVYRTRVSDLKFMLNKNKTTSQTQKDTIHVENSEVETLDMTDLFQNSTILPRPNFTIIAQDKPIKIHDISVICKQHNKHDRLQNRLDEYKHKIKQLQSNIKQSQLITDDMIDHFNEEDQQLINEHILNNNSEMLNVMKQLCGDISDLQYIISTRSKVVTLLNMNHSQYNHMNHDISILKQAIASYRALYSHIT